MNEWKEFLIEDLAEFCNAKRVPLSSMQRQQLQGSYPYYGASGIVDYVNDYIFEGSHVLISEDGENLKSRNTPIAFEASGKFWVNNHAHILKAKEPHLTKILIHYFAQLDLTPYLTGAVQPKLNKATLSKIPLYLPSSTAEQKAIASVLSSLDDKIDLLHRQNKTLEAMAETLFRQWFIEEAKEDWEIFQLQDLAKLQIGRTPPRKESHWFSDNTNDMKWVSIKDLGAHGIFVTYSSEYLPISTIDHFNIPIIPEGTVMLSFKMTVGRVGIAIENMVSNEAIAQFQIKKRLTSELLYCFLKQFNFDTLGSTSSIVTAVNTALLKGIEIALPEDDLIQEFTEQVKSYFDKVKANQLQIQTLENLRDTLLPKLMSGEVRVQYQTEEVA
jgi:type I restriction enzyme S subunit